MYSFIQQISIVNTILTVGWWEQLAQGVGSKTVHNLYRIKLIRAGLFFYSLHELQYQ